MLHTILHELIIHGLGYHTARKYGLSGGRRKRRDLRNCPFSGQRGFNRFKKCSVIPVKSFQSYIIIHQTKCTAQKTYLDKGYQMLSELEFYEEKKPHPSVHILHSLV